MWCDRCRRYQLVQSWETVQNVPPVLMINTSLNKQANAKQLWSVPNWLPERIGIVVEKGRLFCLEGEALRVSHRNRQYRSIAVYNLVGLVADVNSGEHQKSHMVSLINGTAKCVLSEIRVPNIDHSGIVFTRPAGGGPMAPFQ